jgi:GH25 family lysozyme M1 (1,4-beta-N-acetylmuramidase)
MTAEGRDYSSFQNPVTSATLNGLAFAFARVSNWNGTVMGTDPHFSANWAEFKEKGIHRGAYWFFLPGEDAINQARFFVSEVQKCGLEPGDMLVCDSEILTGNVDSVTKTFLDECELLLGPQYPVIVYTDHNVGQHLVSCTDYPLWIAWPSTASEPSAAIISPWKSWRFWQNGEVSGVDRDLYNGTTAQLQTWIAGHVLHPRKVVHYRSLGNWSLNREADAHNSTAEVMLALAEGAHHEYAEAMTAYIAAGKFNTKLPALVYLYFYQN